MISARVPLALLLLGVGGWLAQLSEAARATPRASSGPAAFLGGFAALAAQAVWFRADRAISERDEDRVVLLLRTLVDLEPHAVSAARFAANEIGWNMLQGRPDPAARWSLAREAVRIHSDCVARNPGSAEALANRGRYLVLKVAEDEALAALFTTEVDRRGPLGAARADCERALDLAPRDADAAAGLALASGPLARAAVQQARWDDAADALRSAVRAYSAVLAEARAQLGDELRPGSEAAEALRSTEESLATAQALLAAVTAPAAERAARVAAFERDHPGVLR